MMKISRYIPMFLLVLSACSTSPRSSYYTLTALAPLTSQPVSRTLPSLAIGAVTLPELVDRPHLVISGGNHVDILEFHRWGESLKSSIPRIMADNLSRQLGSDKVAWYPQTAALGAALQLSVDFQNFTSTETGVTVDAIWTVKGNGTKFPLTGRTRIDEKTTGSYETLADAYSRALATLCSDIAKALVVAAQ